MDMHRHPPQSVLAQFVTLSLLHSLSIETYDTAAVPVAEQLLCHMHKRNQHQAEGSKQEAWVAAPRALQAHDTQH